MNTRYYLSNCNNPRLLLGLLFAFVAIFIFFPYASSYFFIFDDYAQLDFVSRHSYKDLLVLSEHGNYRPIAFIFWKTWFYLAGVQNPWFFSFMNLLFHSINALLLRWLLIRFRFKPYTAACASGFFLIFPPINEALFWMSGGHDVYGMTFFLIAILCASFALTPQLRKGAIVWIGIASFSFNVLAMLSKETAYLGFPFVLALFFLQSKKQKLNRTVLATWFFALNGAVIVFFVLRAQVISIHQSAYGNPIDFYSKADVFKNLLNNTWALFSYGYFGDSKVIALVCRVGGILSISTIAGFFWCKRKFGESLLLLTLILALGVTVFVDVGPGAAASGRLLYMSAIPLSIMVAVGIERFYNFSVFKNNKFIRMTVMSFFLFIAGSQLMSQKSFANRFQEATAVARYSMQQVLQFKNENYFYLRNIPFMMSNGPFILKCYAFPFYFRLLGIAEPAFRCDKVTIDYDTNHYLEASARTVDKFTGYSGYRKDEKEIELGFFSNRNCPDGQLESCIQNLALQTQRVHILYQGCPLPEDVLMTTSNYELKILTQTGSWNNANCDSTNCCSVPFKDFSVYINRGLNSDTRTAFFRCFNKKQHFISLDSNCGGATVESQLGYLESEPTAFSNVPVRICKNREEFQISAVDSECPAQWASQLIGYATANPDN